MKKIFLFLFLFLSVTISPLNFFQLAGAQSPWQDENKQIAQGAGVGTGASGTGTGAERTTGVTGDLEIKLTQPKGTFGSVDQIVNIIFNSIIYISGIAFLILFLIGGLQYLTSAGNEDQAGKAKKLLIDAVIGLIIVLGSWAIGTFILDRFGISV